MSSPSNLFWPGLKGFNSCPINFLWLPSAKILTTIWLPVPIRFSTALSFFTATVRPGGSKLACKFRDLPSAIAYNRLMLQTWSHTACANYESFPIKWRANLTRKDTVCHNHAVRKLQFKSGGISSTLSSDCMPRWFWYSYLPSWAEISRWP